MIALLLAALCCGGGDPPEDARSFLAWHARLGADAGAGELRDAVGIYLDAGALVEARAAAAAFAQAGGDPSAAALLELAADALDPARSAPAREAARAWLSAHPGSPAGERGWVEQKLRFLDAEHGRRARVAAAGLRARVAPILALLLFGAMAWLLARGGRR